MLTLDSIRYLKKNLYFISVLSWKYYASEIIKEAIWTRVNLSFEMRLESIFNIFCFHFDLVLVIVLFYMYINTFY